MLPRNSIAATAIFTKGQIFIGRIEVLAPVNKVNPAIIISIKADNLIICTLLLKNG